MRATRARKPVNQRGEELTLLDDDSIAVVARALAHPARVRIVRLLATQANCRGADVFSELPLAQSTISEHLRVLKEAGLVSSHAEGTSMVYCLNPDMVRSVAQSLDSLVRNAPVCAADTAGRPQPLEER